MYAINPLAASRYRDRHNVGGAKSDPGDAKMLADLVRTDRHLHRQIASDTPDAEAIRIMARGHQNLIWTRTRQTNALRSALREYYPAALEAFGDLADRDCLAVLAKAPTPTAGAGLTEGSEPISRSTGLVSTVHRLQPGRVIGSQRRRSTRGATISTVAPGVAKPVRLFGLGPAIGLAAERGGPGARRADRSTTKTERCAAA